MVYCNIAIAIWVADRVFRIFRILKNNIKWRRKGLSCSVAEVTPLKGGDAVRLSVELSTPFKYRPGTHVGSLVWALFPIIEDKIKNYFLGIPLCTTNRLVAISPVLNRLAIHRGIRPDD